MTKRFYILFTVLLSLFTIHHSPGQLVDKTPAAIPNAPAIFQTEPYGDPVVSSIKMDESRAAPLPPERGFWNLKFGKLYN